MLETNMQRKVLAQGQVWRRIERKEIIREGIPMQNQKKHIAKIFSNIIAHIFASIFANMFAMLCNISLDDNLFG